MDQPSPQPEGKTVVCVGVGNVGSQLIGLLVRLAALTKLLIIDGDVYSKSNLACQSITPADVNRPKAVVAAQMAKAIRPDLQVEAIVARVEDVPLGKLRPANVICAAVDSRLSRLRLGEIAWWLGLPLCDSGINAGEQLVRINSYVPGLEAPCLLCSWSERDYELLAKSYSCRGQFLEAPPSGASISLGALAAAWQSIEATKLLAGDVEHALVSRQLLVETGHFRQLVSTLRRSKTCRFDHRAFGPVEGLALTAPTWAALSEAVRGLFAGQPAVFASVPGKPWITRATCETCGKQSPCLRVQRHPCRMPACAKCRQTMTPLGFYLRPRLDLLSLPADWHSRPLSEAGLMGGDVLRLSGADGDRFVELPEFGGN